MYNCISKVGNQTPCNPNFQLSEVTEPLLSQLQFGPSGIRCSVHEPCSFYGECHPMCLMTVNWRHRLLCHSCYRRTITQNPTQNGVKVANVCAGWLNKRGFSALALQYSNCVPSRPSSDSMPSNAVTMCFVAVAISNVNHCLFKLC